jgi:RHS repeat-associated protein
MRRGDDVYYVLGDHLGSTSLVLNDDGTVHSQARYYPYGEQRWSSGTLPTEVRFTGQREQANVGLYHMGARFYDLHIGQFVSPDSIIPQPGNPQTLNRFSYALGNPLRYRDPTGHWDEDWEERFEQEHGRPATDQDWWDYQFSLQFDEWIAGFWEYTASLRALLWGADVTIKRGDTGWRIAQAEAVEEAVWQIGNRFGGDVRRFIGGLTIIMNTEAEPWWARLWRWWNKKPADFGFGMYQEGDEIHADTNYVNVGGFLHEMGHYFAGKHRLEGEYKRNLIQAGLSLQTNASEDFANSFSAYVRRSLTEPTRKDFFSQFLLAVFPHAHGYCWLCQ